MAAAVPAPWTPAGTLTPPEVDEEAPVAGCALPGDGARSIATTMMMMLRSTADRIVPERLISTSERSRLNAAVAELGWWSQRYHMDRERRSDLSTLIAEPPGRAWRAGRAPSPRPDGQVKMTSWPLGGRYRGTSPAPRRPAAEVSEGSGARRVPGY